MATRGKSHPALVNPEILKRARETSFLTLEEAAHAAGIKNPKKLAAAETGEATISFRQAQRLAEYLRIPFSTFYLDQLPQEPSLPRDLRSAERTSLKSFDVVRVMRRMRQQADAASEIIKSLDRKTADSGDLSVVQGAFSSPRRKTVDALAETIAPLVCVEKWDTNARTKLGEPKSGKALNTTKEIVEQHFGILVFEEPIDTKYFRGCADSSSSTSFILLSTKDPVNARRFTLTHELAHLLMRESGFCNPADPQNGDEERLCDEVAGEALVPWELLEREIARYRKAEAEQLVAAVARKYFVSYSAAAVRLAQAEAITWDKATSLLTFYRLRWLEERAKQKETAGGPHPYSTRVRWLGPRFTHAVLNGLDADVISITKAADLLGIVPSYENIRNVREKFIEAYG